jgi:hypothetical protein
MRIILPRYVSSVLSCCIDVRRSSLSHASGSSRLLHAGASVYAADTETHGAWIAALEALIQELRVMAA